MATTDQQTNFFQRTQINPRLQRHFLVFAIGMPSPTSLLAIFETFLEGHLRQDIQGKRFQVGVVQVCASLIKGALSVHKEVGQQGQRLLCQFNARTKLVYDERRERWHVEALFELSIKI